MSDNPKISVIIPVYNAAPYLHRCLDSICKQDYSNIEIICVNDGSTDESLQLLDDYALKEKRIKIISQQNAGAAAARNKGMDAAEGEYLSFIDADDYIFQGLYSTFVRRLAAVRQMDLFMFNSTMYDKDGSEKKIIDPRIFDHELREDEVITHKNFYAVFYGNIGAWNKIYRREFLNQNHLRFVSGCHFEDLIFHFATIVNAAGINVCFQTFYAYMNDNPDSVTRGLGVHSMELFNVFKDLDNISAAAGLKGYYEYALLQFMYERAAKALLHMPEDMRPEFYRLIQDALRRKLSELNPRKYEQLFRYNICYNITNNSLENFLGTENLFFAGFNYCSTPPKDIKISVIVPVYNVKPFLNTCLKSLINQSFRDLEIICVNDGSTDGSDEILIQHAAADARIKIVNQSNKGLAAARNAGVKQAVGKYIMFLDSDDWLRGDALDLLWKQIEKDNADICFMGVNRFIDRAGVLIPENLINELNAKQPKTYHDMKELLFLFPTAWCKIYRFDFWRKNRFYFPEGKVFEDVVVSTKCVTKAEKLAVCPHNLYYYRIRGGSIMRSGYTQKKINDLFTSLIDSYYYLLGEKIYEEVKKPFAAFVHSSFMIHQNQMAPEQIPAFHKQIQNTEQIQDILSVLLK